jgi:hypothetical protein
MKRRDLQRAAPLGLPQPCLATLLVALGLFTPGLTAAGGRRYEKMTFTTPNS